LKSATQEKVVYHVGDIVTIVEPNVFVRVGYPFTKEHALDVAAKEYNDRIYAFMRAVHRAPVAVEIEIAPHEYDPSLYHDLVNALASYWLRLKGYGGKERKIYTETNESLRNTGGWRVFNKRIVKTGTYNRGGWVGSYDGGDYDPPHLANEVSHVLLSLESGSHIDLCVVEIEAANVRRDSVAHEGFPVNGSDDASQMES